MISRTKVDDYFAKRNELLEELSELENTEKFIKETAKTIDELNKEKEEHSEIIQLINQVRNSFFFKIFESLQTLTSCQLFSRNLKIYKLIGIYFFKH